MIPQPNNLKIKIIGIGDSGIGVIRNFQKMNIVNVEYLEINTDWAFLGQSGNPFVRIGKKITRGIGTGAQPYYGEKAAKEDEEEIANNLKDTNLVILVAGFGGGTGSGVSPIIAKISKNLNIPTIAYITTPLDFEGKIRHQNSIEGIEKLQNLGDNLVVISANDVLKNFNQITIIDLFKKIDKILLENILKLIELINSPKCKNKSMQKILKNIT